MMTKFVHANDPVVHLGVQRVEQAVGALKGLQTPGRSGRGAGWLVLAAGMAALMGVAAQMVQSWSEGHLLAGWMVLWLVALASLALLAGPGRRRPGSDGGNAVLREARLTADLSRAMHGIAVQDMRRYRF